MTLSFAAMSAAILVDDRVEPESVTPLALHSHLLVKLNGAELALVALPSPWRHLVQLLLEPTDTTK